MSDDEDMLRAFWSEDDEGTPCLCLCSAWLPACACLQAWLKLAGVWDDCGMRIPHAARPPSGLLPPLAATAAEGVALSDLEDEDAGGRRSRSRRGGGGGRVLRQGSGAASRLQRNAACVKARHNVITAFNPVTQVGSGRACLFSAGQGSGCPAPPRQTSGAAQSHKFLEADAPPLHPVLFAAGAGAPQGEDGGCWRGEGGTVPPPGAACTSPCLLGPHRAAVCARPLARAAPDGRWVCKTLGAGG